MNSFIFAVEVLSQGGEHVDFSMSDVVLPGILGTALTTIFWTLGVSYVRYFSVLECSGECLAVIG